MVPALIIVVLLLLVGNFLYTIYGKRSRARLALKRMRQPIKRRNALVDRLAEEYGEALRSLPRFERVLAMSRRSRDEDLDPEHRVALETDLARAMDELRTEVEGVATVTTAPGWPEVCETWDAIHDEMLEGAVDYNKRVIIYNQAVSTLPGRWAARMLGMGAWPDLVM